MSNSEVSNQSNQPVANGSDADEFIYTREFDAPPQLLWSAWTDPDRLKQWFAAGPMEMAHLEQDLREGGSLHYAMRAKENTSDDKSKWMWGLWNYRTLQEPNLMVLETRFSDANRGTTRHPLSDKWPLTHLSRTTFEPVDDGKKTKLTLRWQPVNATDEECAHFKECHDKCTIGWTGPMNALDEYLNECQASK